MSQLQTGQLLAKASPGAVGRTAVTNKISSGSSYNQKAQPGSVYRSLIQEPLDKPVTPGSSKVVGVRALQEQPRNEELNSNIPAVRTIGPRYIGGPDFSSIQLTPEQQQRLQTGLNQVQNDNGTIPQEYLSNLPTNKKFPNAVYSAVQHGYKPESGLLSYAQDIFENSFDRTLTELEQRLLDMRIVKNDTESSSKKFAKLWPRYKAGGTVRSGYKTQEEADSAGAKQEAQKTEQARQVARMNLAGQQREGNVSKDVTTEQYQAGVRTPPNQTPPTPEITKQIAEFNAQNGDVLGENTYRQPQNNLEAYNMSVSAEDRGKIEAQINFAIDQRRQAQQDYQTAQKYISDLRSAYDEIANTDSSLVSDEDKKAVLEQNKREQQNALRSMRQAEENYTQADATVRSIQQSTGLF